VVSGVEVLIAEAAGGRERAGNFSFLTPANSSLLLSSHATVSFPPFLSRELQ
jgi:hypothetical protein